MKKEQPKLKLIVGRNQGTIIPQEAQRRLDSRINTLIRRMQDPTESEDTREKAKDALNRLIRKEEMKIQRVFEKGDEDASQLQWNIAMASRDHVAVDEGFLYRQMERIRSDNESAQMLLENLGRARWAIRRWERAHLLSEDGLKAKSETP